MWKLLILLPCELPSLGIACFYLSASVFPCACHFIRTFGHLKENRKCVTEIPTKTSGNVFTPKKRNHSGSNSFSSSIDNYHKNTQLFLYKNKFYKKNEAEIFGETIDFFKQRKTKVRLNSTLLLPIKKCNYGIIT